MPSANKVIITCAITGAMHTPTMSPYLPFTPEDITVQAVEAAEAGAAILHLHARDPKDGRPSSDPALFLRFLPQIKTARGVCVRERVSMDFERLKIEIKEIAEIAQSVPEQFRERCFDLLLSNPNDMGYNLFVTSAIGRIASIGFRGRF